MYNHDGSYISTAQEKIGTVNVLLATQVVFVEAGYVPMIFVSMVAHVFFWRNRMIIYACVLMVEEVFFVKMVGYNYLSYIVTDKQLF